MLDALRELDFGVARKFNENHGPDGKFTSGSSSSAPSAEEECSIPTNTELCKKVRSGLSSTKLNDRMYAVNYDGHKLGTVQNVSMDEKPAWVAYHDRVGSKQILTPTMNPWRGPRPTPDGYDYANAKDRNLAYRDTMDAAINDMGDLEAYYREKIVNYVPPVLRLKADFTVGQRNQLAKEGEALPDGSYPIRNAHDLSSAIHLVGMGKDSEGKVKAHIISRAKSLGLESHLPDSWKTSKAQSKTNPLESDPANTDTTQEDSTVDSAPAPQPVSLMLKQPAGAKLKKPSRFAMAQAAPMNISAISASINTANS